MSLCICMYDPSGWARVYGIPGIPVSSLPCCGVLFCSIKMCPLIVYHVLVTIGCPPGAQRGAFFCCCLPGAFFDNHDDPKTCWHHYCLCVRRQLYQFGHLVVGVLSTVRTYKTVSLTCSHLSPHAPSVKTSFIIYKETLLIV